MRSTSDNSLRNKPFIGTQLLHLTAAFLCNIEKKTLGCFKENLTLPKNQN